MWSIYEIIHIWTAVVDERGITYWEVVIGRELCDIWVRTWCALQWVGTYPPIYMSLWLWIVVILRWIFLNYCRKILRQSFLKQLHQENHLVRAHHLSSVELLLQLAMHFSSFRLSLNLLALLLTFSSNLLTQGHGTVHSNTISGFLHRPMHHLCRHCVAPLHSDLNH